MSQILTDVQPDERLPHRIKDAAVIAGLSRKASRLAVRHEPIVALRLDPQNPRLHSRKQVLQIANSIRSFGFNVPVLIDAENSVIAGHGRVLAAKALGWTEVPVIAIEHLDAAQRRAFAIADNRLTENSTWDDRLLAVRSRSYPSSISASILRQPVSIWARSILGSKAWARSLRHPIRRISFLPCRRERSSRVGDLWRLGRHRVLCGNALERSGFADVMEGKTANLVFVDPPYNLPIEGHVSGLGAVCHREFPMASGEMSEAEFTRFLSTTFEQLCAFSRPGSMHYICMDWRHLREFLGAGANTYGDLLNLCVWVKSNGGMGSLYRSQHELIGVFKNGKARHRNNVELGRHGRNRTNVWTYPGVAGFGRQNEEGVLLSLHPTVKPVALVADAILDCSGRGDLVLDAFLGSGTTLIAAERTGRTCYGIELDPHYVDTIIRRWQAYAGEIARHTVSGQSFAELAEERGGQA
jgi:DNA methylase/ParB-like nuclease domain